MDECDHGGLTVRNGPLFTRLQYRQPQCPDEYITGTLVVGLYQPPCPTSHSSQPDSGSVEHVLPLLVIFKVNRDRLILRRKYDDMTFLVMSCDDDENCDDD